MKKKKKAKERKKKTSEKVCLEQKDADPITRWGQVQIFTGGVCKRQINATTRPSPEGLFGKVLCGNFNAPGVFTASSI